MERSTMVFVTGGTGSIGTKLVTELVQKGHIIHVLRRPTEKNRDTEAVPKVSECHPELVSGSHIPLILLDAEPSSA